LVGEISRAAAFIVVFGGFLGLARSLNSNVHRSESQSSTDRKKENQMSSSYRTLVAMAAALLMSTVTVGAAVGPAQANANPIQVSANA